MPQEVIDRLAEPAALADALAKSEKELRESFTIATRALGTSPSVAGQLLAAAEEQGNKIVDAVPRESSAVAMSFRVFTYLINQASCDLDLFVQASRAGLNDGYVRISEGAMPFVLERQTDIVPPLSTLRLTSDLARRETEWLAHFPEDWQQQDPATPPPI